MAYAGYAAQAYLASGVGPVKFVRLLGKSTGNTGEEAGWTIGNTADAVFTDNKAAYGLFLMPSGSNINTGVKAGVLSASLAAVVYCNAIGVGIEGTTIRLSESHTDIQAAGTTVLSSSFVMASNAPQAGFSLGLSDSTTSSSIAFNFDSTSPKYIRTVLNTDPTNLEANKNYGNTDIKYVLGETFDVNVQKYVTSVSSSTGEVLGFTMALQDLATAYGDFRQELTAAKSGWFIGPYPAKRQLFRLVALDDGEDFQKNYYVRISKIVLATAANPEAKFTLEIRKRIDNAPDQTVETFANLSLKETSGNWIAARIGTKNERWNTTSQRFEDDDNLGYPNISSYVRVEIGGEAVDATYGSENLQGDVPLGFLGPNGYEPLTLTETQASAGTARISYLKGASDISYGNESGSFIQSFPNDTIGAGSSIIIYYPTFKFTEKGAKSGQDFQATNTFGLWHKKINGLRTDPSFGDIARRRKAIDPHISNGGSRVSCSFFSLEDVVSSSAGATTYYWVSGSYDQAKGATGVSVSKDNGLSGSTGLIEGLKIKQFAAPFFGGADGVDARYADPFSNSLLSNADKDLYPSYTVEQAIKSVKSSEVLSYELISMPGITDPYQVRNLINILDPNSDSENRADAMAIIDLQGIAQETWANDGTAADGDKRVVITSLTSETSTIPKSSYAASYFPSVWMKDTLNGGGALFKCPPSVAGIGAIAQSEAASQPWFAPAGFNRGGLNLLGGFAGPVVVGTCQHLNRDDRDDLYAAAINPIARFPSTGDTVVFGQKTLLAAGDDGTSALSRINVRRMMLYLKRKIGIIADTILFDQNVNVTWNRFKTAAEDVLAPLKSQQGVTEYRVVLDSTTTTAADIDRNILKAAVYVKPARAIEYIVVDFTITQTGVEF